MVARLLIGASKFASVILLGHKMRIIPITLLAVTFAISISTGAEIIPQIPTTEELASAMGIRPFCADLVLTNQLYPRLVAEITDKEGKITKSDVTPGGPHHDIYRIRIFLFEDGRSRVPKRLIFNLSADDNIAGNAFIDFPPESQGACTAFCKTSSSRAWFYEVWTYGPSSPRELYFQVRFRIETSPTPYPVPSSSFKALRYDPSQNRTNPPPDGTR